LAGNIEKNFKWGNVKERDHLEGVFIDGKVYGKIS
jgi:hypothetical protein